MDLRVARGHSGEIAHAVTRHGRCAPRHAFYSVCVDRQTNMLTEKATHVKGLLVFIDPGAERLVVGINTAVSTGGD